MVKRKQPEASSGSCGSCGGTKKRKIGGQRLVSWCRKKQQSVSTSTAEAEYIAAGSCCAQLLWIRNQLMDYGLTLERIPIMCDNISAISIVANPVNHSMTNHIDIRPKRGQAAVPCYSIGQSLISCKQRHSVKYRIHSSTPSLAYSC
ncbi:hypothetical protein AgCh_000714 [Apium graveolens]